MNEFLKYLWVARTAARSSWAYAGDLIGRGMFFTVLLYIFLRLWKTTYGDSGATQLAGFTLPQMLWYLTITEAILLSGPKVSQAVDEDVRTGALASQLTRPMSYALYRLSSNLGERYVRFMINLVTGSVITSMLVGPAALSLWGLVALLVALPLAFALDFLGNFLVGLGAFWLEDTNGLLLLYSRGTLILGGVLIPLKLFPEAIQPWLLWLPFANIAAGPARIFVDPSAGEMLTLLLHQIVVATLFAGVVAGAYRFALRRVFVNGG